MAASSGLKPQIIQYGNYLDQQSDRPSGTFASLVQHESSFDPTQVSSQNAYGLAQVQPKTAASVGYDPNAIQDPSQWKYNMQAGSAYLNTLIAKYGDLKTALEAYNQGPTSLDRNGGVAYPGAVTYANGILKDSSKYADAGSANIAGNDQSSGGNGTTTSDYLQYPSDVMFTAPSGGTPIPVGTPMYDANGNPAGTYYGLNPANAPRNVIVDPITGIGQVYSGNAPNGDPILTPPGQTGSSGNSGSQNAVTGLPASIGFGSGVPVDGSGATDTGTPTWNSGSVLGGIPFATNGNSGVTDSSGSAGTTQPSATDILNSFPAGDNMAGAGDPNLTDTSTPSSGSTGQIDSNINQVWQNMFGSPLSSAGDGNPFASGYGGTTDASAPTWNSGSVLNGIPFAANNPSSQDTTGNTPDLTSLQSQMGDGFANNPSSLNLTGNTPDLTNLQSQMGDGFANNPSSLNLTGNTPDLTNLQSQMGDGVGFNPSITSFDPNSLLSATNTGSSTDGSGTPTYISTVPGTQGLDTVDPNLANPNYIPGSSIIGQSAGDGNPFTANGNSGTTDSSGGLTNGDTGLGGVQMPQLPSNFSGFSFPTIDTGSSGNSGAADSNGGATDGSSGLGGVQMPQLPSNFSGFSFPTIDTGSSGNAGATDSNGGATDGTSGLGGIQMPQLPADGTALSFPTISSSGDGSGNAGNSGAADASQSMPQIVWPGSDGSTTDPVAVGGSSPDLSNMGGGASVDPYASGFNEGITPAGDAAANIGASDPGAAAGAMDSGASMPAAGAMDSGATSAASPEAMGSSGPSAAEMSGMGAMGGMGAGMGFVILKPNGSAPVAATPQSAGGTTVKVAWSSLGARLDNHLAGSDGGLSDGPAIAIRSGSTGNSLAAGGGGTGHGMTSANDLTKHLVA